MTIQKNKKIVPKKRASGTMTEAQFWGKIRAALRRASMYWKPIETCKKEAKRAYTGVNKRQKFEYLCKHCLLYFSEKEISVDHTIPAGSLNNSNDLKGFVERLFCESEGLTVLCNTCHNIKTIQDKLNIKNKKI